MATSINNTGLPVRWWVDDATGLAAVSVSTPDIGYYAYNRDTGFLYQALQAGSGATIWSAPQQPGNAASAVNYIKLSSAGTGAMPVISCEGEADTGIDFENSEGEEILQLDAVATALYNIKITNAATGTKPIIATAGAVDIGIDFETSEGEEMLTLTPVATALYNVNIVSAASGSVPAIQSAGANDIGLEFETAESEEMLELGAVATALYNIKITNAATGTKPIIATSGAVDIGIDFETSESEEMLILSPVATAVNEITIANAATGAGPEIQSTGGDTNINIELKPKGTGYVDVQGGMIQETLSLTATNSDAAGNSIPVGCVQAYVTAVANDADDWIVLPAIASCPIGHTITVANNSGSNCEVRTPGSSNTKINNVDADGSQELLFIDTAVVVFRKISDGDGWTACQFPIAGGVSAAVTPD